MLYHKIQSTKYHKSFTKLKTIIISSLIIIGIIIAYSATVLSENNPNAVFSSTNWDFGYLPQKSEVDHTFYLQNRGTSPLIVSKIKSGCSCTSISKVDAPILPGDSVPILITFKSGRYYKNIAKSTKVYTNDPLTPLHKLIINANVYKKDESLDLIVCNPNKLHIDVDKRGLFESIDTLEITNKSTETLEITELHIPAFVNRIDIPQIIKPNEIIKLIISIYNSFQFEKSKGYSITLGFINKDTSIVTIPINVKK